MPLRQCDQIIQSWVEKPYVHSLARSLLSRRPSAWYFWSWDTLPAYCPQLFSCGEINKPIKWATPFLYLLDNTPSSTMTAPATNATIYVSELKREPFHLCQLNIVQLYFSQSSASLWPLWINSKDSTICVLVSIYVFSASYHTIMSATFCTSSCIVEMQLTSVQIHRKELGFFA